MVGGCVPYADDDDDNDRMKDSNTKSIGSVRPQLLFNRLHAIFAANNRIMSSVLFHLFRDFFSLRQLLKKTNLGKRKISYT